MKTTLFTTLFLLCLLTPAAFGQAISHGVSAFSKQHVVIQFPGHPQHALEQPMRLEKSLLAHYSYTFARGERPISEVSQLKAETPLGDIARLLRSQHATAKKAVMVAEQ
jgi:hypothetical protein